MNPRSDSVHGHEGQHYFCGFLLLVCLGDSRDWFCVIQGEPALREAGGTWRSGKEIRKPAGSVSGPVCDGIACVVAALP